jgi:ribosome-binding factor A
VSRLLREIVADELERVVDNDERLTLLTVTHVTVEPDLRHATVMLSSMDEVAEELLQAARPRLQAAIARQVRLKRTPQLSFTVDPAVTSGERVEEILRLLGSDGGSTEP